MGCDDRHMHDGVAMPGPVAVTIIMNLGLHHVLIRSDENRTES